MIHTEPPPSYPGGYSTDPIADSEDPDGKHHCGFQFNEESIRKGSPSALMFRNSYLLAHRSYHNDYSL